jgi:hypothetical protein
MSVLGSGIIPSGSIGAELTNVTRRAFIPKMIVQLYNSTPLLAALISNSQSATGGVSSVTAPVQGQQFVNAQWSDYSGSFNQPSVQQGAFNAEFNLKLMVVPIPFLGMEGAVQLDHTVIPLIEARMNDATNTAMDTMATALYNNTTNTSAFIGLPGAIDDGTNMVTYGNINRNTYTWWKSKVYAAGSVNPTRSNVLQYIAGTVKNGSEVPTFGVVGFGTWTLLAQDFVAQESYQITPGSGFDRLEDGPRAAFQALMVGGIPIYADPYCPEGSLYLINSNYLNLYIHQQATVPNFQLGYVGAVVAIAELVNVKPKSMTRVGGFNSLTI